MSVLDINGTTIFYRDQGNKDGPVLVLSHSIFFDHRMFEPLVERLGGQYRIISYDHRGQGQSGRSDMEIIDMDTLAEDAAALIEALDLAPCYFLGNSMGCFPALRLAARKPHLLKGCMVLGGSGEAEEKLEEFRPLVEEMAKQGAEPFIDTLMPIMFGETTLTDPARAGIRDFWRQFMLELGPDIARSVRGVIHRQDMLDELKSVSVPLLVLVGTEDHANDVTRSQRIADAVPLSEMHVVDKAGHSLALESPDVVAGYIEAFIRRVEQSESVVEPA
jgi:3-oxoadipate enol-lactonase